MEGQPSFQLYPEIQSSTYHNTRRARAVPRKDKIKLLQLSYLSLGFMKPSSYIHFILLMQQDNVHEQASKASNQHSCKFSVPLVQFAGH